LSSKDNKPDLSHLKSRLGLKKSAGKSKGGDQEKKSLGSGGQATLTKPKKKSGGAASGGGVNDRLAALKKSTLKSQPEPEPEPDSVPVTLEPIDDGFSEFDQPAAQPRQQTPAGGGAPRGHGPPPGAQGPPPTAMAPPKQRQRAPLSSDGQGEGAEDIGLDQVDLDGGSMFSIPVLILFLVLFVIGGAFGLFFAEANQSRQIETTRINDAQSMLDDLEDRFAALGQALEIIGSMDPTEIDFESAEALAELEFWVDASIYPTNRMLMGEEVLRPLNEYVAESNVLTYLIEEHHALTSRIDREELEAFKEHADGLDDDRQLAVVFFPGEGVLVLVDEEEEPDENEEVSVYVIANSSTDRVNHQRVARLDVNEFYQIDADNALQRYSRRINRLQHHADEIGGRLEQIESSLGDLASSDPSPLLSF
jgi:hypothetical protein